MSPYESPPAIFCTSVYAGFGARGRQPAASMCQVVDRPAETFCAIKPLHQITTNRAEVLPMADQSVAAAQGDGRPGVVDPYEQACSKFQDVLRHELAIVAARRRRLDSERGDLEAGGPPLGGDAAGAAWAARLLGVSFSGGGIRSATFNLGVLQALAGRGVL